MSDLLKAIMEKRAAEEQQAELTKVAEEVYSEGYVKGWTDCLQKLAEDLVTPGDSPAGNQVAMTIEKAKEVSAKGGGDPQVIDSGEEGQEMAKAAEEAILAYLLKTASTDPSVADQPTAEEVSVANSNAAAIAEAAQEAATGYAADLAKAQAKQEKVANEFKSVVKAHLAQLLGQ